MKNINTDPGRAAFVSRKNGAFHTNFSETPPEFRFSSALTGLDPAHGSD